jgi:succinylglutamate desuccinylase
MSYQLSDNFLSFTRKNEWHAEPQQFDSAQYHIELWDTGVVMFTPKQTLNTEKAFVFSCAVHGNETAPIEISDEIIEQLKSDSLTICHPVLFIFGNPASINIGERFVEENMNRLFSGYHSKGTAPDGSQTNKERQRAEKLEHYVTRFFALYPNAHKTHYDLHTAIRDSAHEKFAVYPYIHGKNWKKEQFEILRAMGVTTFLLMQKPATTFSYYSSNQHGADSFTVELGKVRPFGENDQTKFAAAKQTLIELLKGTSFDGEQFDSNNYQLFEVNREITKHNESFSLAFDDNTANFTTFKQGQAVAFEDDKTIAAEVDGEAIVFPNAHVANGQRAILMVSPADIDDRVE